MKNILLCVLLSFLVGCASAGIQIDPNRIKDIQKGITTEREVIDFFGRPSSSGATSDGEVYYIYTFVRTNTKAATFVPVVGLFTGGSDTEIEILQIWFDSNKVVKNFHFNTNDIEVRLGR